MAFDSLRGQVIAVTGGSSGIGLSIAQKLLRIGAKVAIADLNPPAANAFDGVGKLNADFTYTKVDVSQRDEVHEWVESTVKTFGRLDGMIPNAGVCPDEENYYEDDRIQLQLKVNVMGVWICATEAFKQFKRQNTPGSIVITASSQGLRGGPSNPGYAASKHAVVGMMKSLAVDWTPQGVRINAVAPGPIDTPLQKSRCTDPEWVEHFMSKVPSRREASPAEVADSFLFLLADTASFITGTVLSCDGGLTI